MISTTPSLINKHEPATLADAVLDGLKESSRFSSLDQSESNRIAERILRRIHEDVQALHPEIDAVWVSEQSVEQVLRPLVDKVFEVTENPKTGSMDAILRVNEIAVAYVDPECLRDCASPTYFHIDEFELKCDPVPTIFNGMKIIVFELTVVSQPLNSTVNGKENEAPF